VSCTGARASQAAMRCQYGRDSGVGRPGPIAGRRESVDPSMLNSGAQCTRSRSDMLHGSIRVREVATQSSSGHLRACR
jgi:hypothetical protein